MKYGFLNTTTCIFLSIWCSGASAQEPVSTTHQSETTKTEDAKSVGKVTITGNEAGDQSATKRLVGREEILRGRESNLLDTMRRLPGISIDAITGLPRLKGIGSGFTQILVDGLTPPLGFRLDAVDPNSIERIEIIDSANGEFASSGVAGTINIVMRKRMRKSDQNASFEAVISNRTSANASATVSTATAGGLQSTSTVSFFQNDSVTGSSILESFSGSPEPKLISQSKYIRNPIATLISRVSLVRESGSTLSFDANLLGAKYDQEVHADFRASTVPSVMTRDTLSATVNSAFFDLAYVGAGSSGPVWTVNLRPNVHVSDGQTDYLYGVSPAASHVERDGHNRTVQKSLEFQVTRSWRPGRSTTIKAGYTGKALHEKERWRSVEFDLESGGSRRDDFDGTQRVTDNAIFVSTSSQIISNLYVDTGLRATSHTATVGLNGARIAETSSTKIAPSFALKFTPNWIDGASITLALSRNFQYPTMQQLIPRRRQVISEENSALYPIAVGNPRLRIARTDGLDVGFEWQSDGGEFAAWKAFYRRGADAHLLSTKIDPESVWISEPINWDRSTAYGISADTRISIPTRGNIADRLYISGSLGISRHRFVGFPDSIETVAGTTPVTLSAGIQWLPSTGTSLSLNYSNQSSVWQRDALNQVSFRSSSQFLTLVASRDLTRRLSSTLTVQLREPRPYTSHSLLIDPQPWMERYYAIEASNLVKFRMVYKF